MPSVPGYEASHCNGDSHGLPWASGSAAAAWAVGRASSSGPAQTPSPADSDATPKPFVLDGTEVRTLHMDGTDRDYQVFVSLPIDYAADPKRQYPVMFVTDPSAARRSSSASAWSSRG
jgi:hypothetical protein